MPLTGGDKISTILEKRNSQAVLSAVSILHFLLSFGNSLHSDMPNGVPAKKQKRQAIKKQHITRF